MIQPMMTNKLFLCIVAAILFQVSNVRAEIPYEWHSQSEVYNAKFETVVNTVTDYDNYLKILPFVDKMKVISRRGPEAICYFEQFELNTTFWTQLKFKVVKSTPDLFILRTTYMKGNAHPFQSEIVVEKISETQTKVTSKLIVESPGPGFVPDSIINHYMNNFLKESLKNLKKHLGG